MPFQTGALVTSTLLCSLPAKRLPVSGMKQLSAALLRLWARAARQAAEPSWRWVLNGGKPAAPSDAAVVAQVYLTGGRRVPGRARRRWLLQGAAHWMPCCCCCCLHSSTAARLARAPAAGCTAALWPPPAAQAGSRQGRAEARDCPAQTCCADPLQATRTATCGCGTCTARCRSCLARCPARPWCRRCPSPRPSPRCCWPGSTRCSSQVGRPWVLWDATAAAVQQRAGADGLALPAEA
jgi:hypothetical protein